MPMLAPIKFQPPAEAVEAYLAIIDQKVAMITEIPPQRFQSVRDAVWRAVMAGGDLATLSKELQNHGISYHRAGEIATHQCNMAKAIMENVRRLKLGITEAIWLHSGGGESPRPSHITFSGQRFNLTTGAFLDGKWVWPGSEPDCLCTSRAILEGYND
jgi:uncharacterized protein with gpF-like domain